MNREEMYQSENLDADDNWTIEKHLLETKIAELKNALDKSKKFHQKFVDDVIDSEDGRNREFERAKRELKAINKEQLAQIRQLTKDKNFYKITCNELMKEKEMSVSKLSIQSATPSEPCEKAMATETSSSSKSLHIPCPKTTRGASKYKISTKVFEDNKKLKDKVSKLSKVNATLRQQVQRLEKSIFKMKTGKEQHQADQQKVMDILLSSTRTNQQTFNQLALFKLDESYGIISNN